MKKLIAILLLSVVCLAPTHTQPTNRAKTINDTLDQVISVLSDYKTKHQNPTWQELSEEVCRRMKTKRDSWYMRQ